MKPVASSRGRGIRLLGKNAKVRKKENYLVSEYLTKPHLINGLKYDLRLYVVVTSLFPLRIYLYREGLVRFATEPYKVVKENLGQRFMHLTNYSVNKKSQNFVRNSDPNQDGVGNKWSLRALALKFAELNIPIAPV